MAKFNTQDLKQVSLGMDLPMPEKVAPRKPGRPPKAHSILVAKKTGRDLRDEGIARVDRDSFSKEVLSLFKPFVVSWRFQNGERGFLAEDFRAYVEKASDTRAHHSNAWGAVWHTLARRGSIVPTGEVAQGRNPINHACVRRLWRATIVND